MADKQQQQIVQIKVELVDPNPFQQRKDFDQAGIRELADSIKSQGMVTPISVRRHPDNPERYQLIAGERRLRAHKLLKRAAIDAIVRDDIDDQRLEELALIENVQREDLSPIEEANGFQRLLERCDGNVEEVVRRVGKSRPTVEKRLALLALCPEVQTLVDTRELTLEQAEVLLEVADSEEQLRLAKAARRARMDANRLRGLVQQKMGGKRGKAGDGDGKQIKKVSFEKLNRDLIAMADSLERLDTTSFTREQVETIQAQLAALKDQFVDETLPALENQLKSRAA